MDLMQLIHCYDGCKKLELTKASAKLERLITKVSSKLLKDYNAQNKENDDEEIAKEETTQETKII
jgi:hypothetical protein